MKRITVATLILTIACLLFAFSAQALEFGVRGYYWFPKISGELAVGDDGITGTRLDIEDDLNIDDENIPSVEAFLGAGRHHLSLTYTPLDYSGDAFFSQPISFRGQSFVGDVTSDFDATMLDLDYQYDLLNLENILAGFSIGPILKVKYLDGDVKLKAVATGVEQKESFSYALPMIGVGAHVGIIANLLEARAKVTGMAYSDNHIYDAMADLSFTPFPFLDIHGGYRYLKVKYDEDDVYIDTKFTGPYVALTVGF